MCKITNIREVTNTRNLLGSLRDVLNARIRDGYAVLKRFLLIFSDLIFESRVVPGIPSLAAAPDGPNTRPLVSRSAASIISFSWVASFSEKSNCTFGSVAEGRRESQLSSTEKVSVSHTMTERSITFCNSRILPGQEYD